MVFLTIQVDDGADSPNNPGFTKIDTIPKAHPQSQGYILGRISSYADLDYEPISAFHILYRDCTGLVSLILQISYRGIYQ